MSEAQASVMEFSLADFAELDTDAIKELKSILFPAGLFTVVGRAVAMTQSAAQTNEDGTPKPPLISLGYRYEVLEGDPLDKEIEPEKLIGRMMNDRFTFWPDQIQDLIGLLKGRYTKIGLPNSGRLGGMEGGEPGWVDGIVDHIFKVRVRHLPRKGTDEKFAVYDWMGPVEESEAA